MRISDWSSDVCSSDLEQFDLITAARHGIGKPCDGFFNREASPIRRAINFDTIDGARFALSRRWVRFFLLLIFVESHLSVRFRFRDFRRDLADCRRARLDEHHAKIAFPDYGRAIAAKQALEIGRANV